MDRGCRCSASRPVPTAALPSPDHRAVAGTAICQHLIGQNFRPDLAPNQKCRNLRHPVGTPWRCSDAVAGKSGIRQCGAQGRADPGRGFVRERSIFSVFRILSRNGFFDQADFREIDSGVACRPASGSTSPIAAVLTLTSQNTQTGSVTSRPGISDACWPGLVVDRLRTLENYGGFATAAEH